MIFLLKCAVFLGIVFLLIARDDAPSEASRIGGSRPAGETAARRPESGAGARALSDLAEAAAARFAGAARDQCLAHPADCLRAAERLGQAVAPEPPRRPALHAAP